MKVIIDTDIASAFAKTERLQLLKQLFGKSEPIITPEIYKELLVPLNYGFSFPHIIFQNLKVIYSIDSEIIEFQESLLKNPKLGRGEMEAIALCKSRDYAYAAIDRLALDFAESDGIVIFPIDVILRLLWIKNILSKTELEEFIEQLEEKVCLKIKNTQKIFEDK